VENSKGSKEVLALRGPNLAVMARSTPSIFVRREALIIRIAQRAGIRFIHSMLPTGYFIDYESLLLKARYECRTDLPLFLWEHLPTLWRDAYLNTIPHEPNLVG
jgi:hypothetical protein